MISLISVISKIIKMNVFKTKVEPKLTDIEH